MKVSAQYAVEHFAELLSAQDRGEEVEIARDSKPTLMLVTKPEAAPANCEAAQVRTLWFVGREGLDIRGLQFS